MPNVVPSAFLEKLDALKAVPGAGVEPARPQCPQDFKLYKAILGQKIKMLYRLFDDDRFLGIVVGTILIAMYLPLFEMNAAF